MKKRSRRFPPRSEEVPPMHQKAHFMFKEAVEDLMAFRRPIPSLGWSARRERDHSMHERLSQV